MLELVGENLHSSLKVWFGEVESETELRLGQGQECLQCVVPDISHFYPLGCTWLSNPTQVRIHVHSVASFLKLNLQVSLSLVRHDGVIYPTGLTFTFTPEMGPSVDSSSENNN